MKTYGGWAQKQLLLIFWGLILNHFHLNINRFDLLPDFVGFILFYLAIDGLALNLPEYDRLKTLAAVFGVIELAGLVMGMMGIRFPIPVSVAIALLFVYFDYQLFTLVIDTARIHSCDLRAESLSTVRLGRLVCNVLSAVMFLLSDLPILVGVISVAMIVVVIWSCVEVHGLQKELGEQGTEA